MKKLKSERGETLVETLAAMLVITLALMMLAGAINIAARLNKQAAEVDSFASKQPLSSTKINVDVMFDGHESKTYPRNGAKSERLYYYA